MEKISILLGKGIRKASQIRGSGGSALPGLVVEKISPNFIRNTLEKLPYGVVVISGTNGKTTTTKIVSELLKKQGLKVFTNKTGSNFVRGVISEILGKIKLNGTFDYDIAVLELDEAHAVKFSEVAPIDYALILNVQRDQLDRFCEIDHTAELLQKVASVAKQGVVLNREDPRVAKIKAEHITYFGLSTSLQKQFPSDDDLLDKKYAAKKNQHEASVILEKLKDNTATYKLDGKDYQTELTLKGVYNAYNAAGALALCKEIVKDAKPKQLLKGLSEIESAFGRGESFQINGAEVELLLVKNPSAFELSLASFADDSHDFMIAINDNIADGRDVSWLWNVNFTKLSKVAVTAGTRAADMALRLKYDEVRVTQVVEDLDEATRKFTLANKKPKRIFATYTAMLEIRKIISGKSIL